MTETLLKIMFPDGQAEAQLELTQARPKEESREQLESLCSWCGEMFFYYHGPGRKPQYCKPSHKVSACNARKKARQELKQAENIKVTKQNYYLEFSIEGQEFKLTKFLSRELMLKIKAGLGE